MATEVKVPSMGESISSGILAAWHVQDGDVVSEGQTLYELETDKITSEGQAECGGKISLSAGEGDEVEIGQVIATIDESVSAPKSTPAASDPEPEAAAVVTPTPASATGKDASGELSPAVRKMAAETGINPENVAGTGKNGRVTKGDMIGAQASGGASAPAAAPATSSAKAPAFTGERTTRTKISPMRRKIAERLVAAQQEAAMLTTFNEVDMSPIMKLRKQHQDSFVKQHGIKLGFMSFFVKASVHALKMVPALNAQIDGNEIIQNHFYDVSVAVGGPKGLVVPVVRDCDQLSFAGIEQGIMDYALKAKEGKISMEDMMGGVFTISNGGIYGSMLSTPIINPPQSSILGMHNIKERAVVVNGEVTVRPMMYLALSYDHRLVDGKEAVTFLNTIKECLEDPARLLFEI
jgi:2-oxoglutarate dehydrogenase E2 component (dihydrolipoamide succinyltransferase)